MADGDGPSRNFRSVYYEKLGFCGNDEKNILESLLASSPNLDPDKLNDLCAGLDSDKRCVETWKILLGLECNRNSPFDEFANVRRVRAEHFQLLKHHLEVLIRYNVVIRNRLKFCSDPPSLKHSQDPNEQSTGCTNNQTVQKNEESTEVVCKGTKNGDVLKSETAGDETDIHTIPDYNKCANEGNASVNLEPEQVSAEELMKEIETNPGKLISLMYLLEGGRLESLIAGAQLDPANFRKLSAIGQFFVNVSRDLQEAFFLFRSFIRKIEEDESINKVQQDSDMKA